MPLSADRYDLIVAGGGAVGHALALALATAFKGAFRVALVDPAATGSQATTRADARAFAIGGGSRRLLEALGIWQGMCAEVQTVVSVEITDSRLNDGLRPVLLAYDTQLATGEPAMSIVRAGVLARQLRQAVERAPGVTLVDGSSVTRLDRDSGAARVSLSDGRVLGAPLVVAADGRRSALRDAAGIKTVRWSHDQIGLVAIIRHELAHRCIAVQHFLPGGPFAILPLPGPYCCITWSEAKGEAERLLAMSSAYFLEGVDRRIAGRLGAVQLADGPQGWPLDSFLSRSLVDHRFALIGDAVRGVHPIAGQGLNLGLRDVAALAEVIVDAARCGQDVGSTVILERYERWRRADGVMSAGSFDALNRLFSNDYAAVRTLRDAGLSAVDRLPHVKSRLVAEAAGLTGDLPRLFTGAPL